MTHKSRISTVLDGIVRRSRRAAQEAAQKRRRVEVDRAENIVQSIVRREAARSAEAIRCEPVFGARAAHAAELGAWCTPIRT